MFSIKVRAVNADNNQFNKIFFTFTLNKLNRAIRSSISSPSIIIQEIKTETDVVSCIMFIIIEEQSFHIIFIYFCVPFQTGYLAFGVIGICFRCSDGRWHFRLFKKIKLDKNKKIIFFSFSIPMKLGAITTFTLIIQQTYLLYQT